MLLDGLVGGLAFGWQNGFGHFFRCFPVVAVLSIDTDLSSNYIGLAELYRQYFTKSYICLYKTCNLTSFEKSTSKQRHHPKGLNHEISQFSFFFNDLCYQSPIQLRRDGMTVLLVEQNTERVLKIADHICVLESGSTVWQGSAEAACNDPKLTEAYLGMH